MSMVGDAPTVTSADAAEDGATGRLRRITANDGGLLDSVAECLARLRTATDPHGLAAAITAVLRGAAGVRDVAVASRTSSGWSLLGWCGDPVRVNDLLPRLPTGHLGTACVQLDDDTLAFVADDGRVALVVGGPMIKDQTARRFLSVLADTLDMSIALQTERRQARQTRGEVDVLTKVAVEILSVRDLDRVLAVATDEILQLLDADMAAVMLRDGDDVILRRCAGNLTAKVLSVRYHPGHGLAGRVLQDGRSCKVDDYFDSDDTISSHYHELARSEQIVVALGAPLRRGDETLGVVEVWRRERRPFDDADVRRLEAVANLAMIAIENARLYEAQKESVEKLAGTQISLEKQMSVLERSASTQRKLIEALLEGQGLSAVIHTVSHLVGCGVIVLTTDMRPTVFHPPTMDLEPVVAAARSHVDADDAESGGPSRVQVNDAAWLSIQRIQAGHDWFGWVCLVTDEEPGHEVELALGQTTLTVALAHLEGNAASKARAELRDEVLWDLLHGSPDHRHAAIDRAKRLGIDVGHPHRVYYFLLENLAETEYREGWDPHRYEAVRSRVRSIVEQCLTVDGRIPLVSLRGDLVLILAPSGQRSGGQQLAETMADQLAVAVPNVSPAIGISSATDNPLEYAKAYEESRLARLAASQLDRRCAVFDELGVMQLLLSSQEGADLRGFVTRTLGAIIDYEARRPTPFLETLRTYFEADCVMKEAAERMYAHPKTLRYRLRRIEELTGLRLDRHADRVSADLALKVHDLMSARDDGDSLASN